MPRVLRLESHRHDSTRLNIQLSGGMMDQALPDNVSLPSMWQSVLFTHSHIFMLVPIGQQLCLDNFNAFRSLGVIVCHGRTILPVPILKNSLHENFVTTW